MDQRSRGHLLTKAIANREKRATQIDRAQNAEKTLIFFGLKLHIDILDKLTSMVMRTKSENIYITTMHIDQYRLLFKKIIFEAGPHVCEMFSFW